MWGRLGETGIDIELYERGKESGKEQGVDQCLQVHMLRALADASIPEVAVLMTGDGAGYDDGAGFHADLERMKNHGWGIEVLSWDAPCRRSLKEWARSVGAYIPLDSFYEAITFRPGVRRQDTLSLARRALAHSAIAA